MEQTLIMAEQLAANILKSGFYNDYISAKQKLVDNPEICNQVVEFRKLQMNDKISELNDNKISFDREKYLSKLYSDLMLVDTARDFFYAEKKFLETYSKITNIIVEKLDIELFEL